MWAWTGSMGSVSTAVRRRRQSLDATNRPRMQRPMASRFVFLLLLLVLWSPGGARGFWRPGQLNDPEADLDTVSYWKHNLDADPVGFHVVYRSEQTSLNLPSLFVAMNNRDCIRWHPLGRNN